MFSFINFESKINGNSLLEKIKFDNIKLKTLHGKNYIKPVIIYTFNLGVN